MRATSLITTVGASPPVLLPPVLLPPVLLLPPLAGELPDAPGSGATGVGPAGCAVWVTTGGPSGGLPETPGTGAAGLSTWQGWPVLPHGGGSVGVSAAIAMPPASSKIQQAMGGTISRGAMSWAPRRRCLAFWKPTSAGYY